MDEIVGRVDSFESGGERFRFEQVTSDDLDVTTPRAVPNPFGITYEDADTVSASEEARNEASADVPCGARDQDVPGFVRRVLFSGLRDGSPSS